MKKESSEKIKYLKHKQSYSVPKMKRLTETMNPQEVEVEVQIIKVEDKVGVTHKLTVT